MRCGGTGISGSARQWRTAHPSMNGGRTTSSTLQRAQSTDQLRHHQTNRAKNADEDRSVEGGDVSALEDCLDSLRGRPQALGAWLSVDVAGDRH